jgi:transposase InsO family protein
MGRAASPSTGRRYSLARVCRVLEVPRSTVYATRARRLAPTVPRKRGPKTAWTDAELTEQIRGVLARSPFVGEGYRKVWARLRLAGIRTSKPRVLRLMREAGLLAPTRTGRPHGPAAHDGTIIPDRPDARWGIDATAGWTDHGSQFMSDLFQAELRFLGIASSPAFVREPEGNGCAERFIRTLKEQLLWIERFDSVEALRLALLAFKDRYNREWLVERHGHHTPSAVRAAFAADVAA